MSEQIIKVIKKNNIFKKIMELQSKPDKLLKVTRYWTPPVLPWKPAKKLNSNLKIAAIVSNRLFHGMQFEAELLLLTENNWKQVLNFGRPDFLFIESTWFTATGNWYMSQSVPGQGQDELKQVIIFARKKNIPSVFWFTWDKLYHEYFKEIAYFFDYVFCADPGEIDALKTLGINANLLLPAVQPMRYNAFREYSHRNAINTGILYDGWADLDKFESELTTLEKIKKYGLYIIDSKNIIFENRMAVLPNYKSSILGCVNEESRIMALKYAKASVSFDISRLSLTTRQWMSIEAASAMVPQLHLGRISPGDIRNEVLIDFSNETDFIDQIRMLLENDIYRAGLSQKAWRTVNGKHLMSHRLRDISKCIGIEHDWVEYPKVSIIIPTYRKNLLKQCIKKFDSQNYSNKELIIVYNSNQSLTPELSELIFKRDNIKILTAPSEVFTGGAMNVGLVAATGYYCCKIDDDDDYGANYILDLVLHARGINADIFGKYPRYYYYKSDSSVYQSRMDIKLCVFKPHEIEFGNAWISGNTIAGRKEILKKIWFNSKAYGSADSQLIFQLKEYNPDLTLAILDSLNMVIVRQKDSTNHTWKIDEKVLKQRQSPARGSLDQIYV